MSVRPSLLTDEELQRIKNHALTSKVTKDAPACRRCECCNEPIVDSQLGICCEVQEFAHLGMLYPLYFCFILYIGCFLCMASMFSLVNAHFNLEGNACGQAGSLSCRTSVTNIISELDYQDEFDTQTINNCLFVGASVLYLEIMSSLLKKKCRVMKNKQCSESDYGVIFKNVSSSKPMDIYNEIRQLEAKYTARTGKVNRIIKFVMLSNMRAYSENEERLITQNQAVDISEGMFAPPIESAGYITDTVTAPNVNLMEKDANRSDETTLKSTFSGKVIVFFMNPTKPSQFRGVDLQALTDSSDIIWENIGLKREENRKVWMLIGTGILMSLAFLIILGLKLWIKKLSEGQHFATTTFLNLVVATVVAVFNSIEGIVIRQCARRELYGTHSKFFKIVARRLSYVFFINMVMTTFFSNLVLFLWNDESDKVLPLNYDGLVTDFFFLFLTNTYMSSIFNYFDLFFGYKLLKRWRVEKTRNRTGYSDEQLNFIFQGHPVDMGLRYGNIMKTLFFTAFISPFVPLGTVFSLFGLLICYWVDKYLLLRRYVVRHELSPFFAKEMTEFCKFYVILYALSNLLLQMIPLNKGDQIETISNSGLFLSIGVFVGTCIYKFVLTYLKRIIFRKKRGRQYSPSRHYENVKQYFRNRFEDKLKVIDVANLKGENPNEVDRKLLHSVRVSTIERVVEEYP